MRAIGLGRVCLRAHWRLKSLGCLTAGAISLGVVMLPSAAAATGPQGTNQCPWVTSNAPIPERVAQVMASMTLDQKIILVEGHGTTNEGPNPSPNPYVFWMPGISALCIPKLGEEDGPAGTADGLTGVTQLPAGVVLAATWSRSLAQQYGQVIGSEEVGKGADVNLGPTVNIDRDPRWGRSFEAFTEDPFLNGQLATNEIEGVQSTGEMSQVKHYAAYNQETNRNTAADNVIVSNRVLQEVYLPAFEAAVNQAKAASVMCSYSVINGDYACQNKPLETGVLRNQWDFPGFMTSDYGALHATSGAIDGTDQEQPENTFFGSPLEDAINGHAIPMTTVNTMVSRMLTEMFRFNLFRLQRPSTTSATVTSAAHQAVANQVDDAGTVLLRNDGTLPLSAKNGGNIAVIGPAADAQVTTGGGGSAFVTSSGTIDPLQGLQAAASGNTSVTYTQGLPTDTQLSPIPAADLSTAFPAGGVGFGGSFSATLTPTETGTYIIGLTNPCGCYSTDTLSVNGTPVIADPGTPPVSAYSAAVTLTAGQPVSLKISGGGEASNLDWATPSDLAPDLSAAAAAAASAKTAVVVVSDDTESEAVDRPNLTLPSAQDELIEAVAAANPHTVVVINAGAPVAMPWVDKVASIVDAWYPGQESGTSLADVLFGKVDPSGHLPVTFPASLADVPASTPEQFPGTNGQVLYTEGLNVGYKWYDSNRIAPLFPFGFGLSYTKFKFSHLQVHTTDSTGTGDVQVSATLTNTGGVAGADVAQLYLTDPAAAGEPRKLADFQKVTLQPGQSQTVNLTVTPKDTWWWDNAADGWTQSPGTYGIAVGDSSAMSDLPLQGSFNIAQTAAARQVVVHSPREFVPGQAGKVFVRLTRSGNATLSRVSLQLQVPAGWTAEPIGRTTFSGVGPSKAPVAAFAVTPPSYAPLTTVTVHATADLGSDAQRESGVGATVVASAS